MRDGHELLLVGPRDVFQGANSSDASPANQMDHEQAEGSQNHDPGCDSGASH
jgi:hypothetical protein